MTEERQQYIAKLTAHGVGYVRIAHLLNVNRRTVLRWRKKLGIRNERARNQWSVKNAK